MARSAKRPKSPTPRDRRLARELEAIRKDQVERVEAAAGRILATLGIGSARARRAAAGAGDRAQPRDRPGDRLRRRQIRPRQAGALSSATTATPTRAHEHAHGCGVAGAGTPRALHPSMSNDAPCTTVLVGRCHLIAWTLADGAEVINAYVPTTDREYPDGLMLIGSSGGSPTGAAHPRGRCRDRPRSRWPPCWRSAASATSARR
jgi:hypothetical protein